MTTREKWLLGILSGIFVVQAGVFIWGFRVCTRQGALAGNGLNTACPEIGKRFDTTFGTMIATTLALLTGATVVGPAIAKHKAKQEIINQALPEPKIIPPYPLEREAYTPPTPVERKPYTPPTPGRQ